MRCERATLESDPSPDSNQHSIESSNLRDIKRFPRLSFFANKIGIEAAPVIGDYQGFRAIPRDSYAINTQECIVERSS